MRKKLEIWKRSTIGWASKFTPDSDSDSDSDVNSEAPAKGGKRGKGKKGGKRKAPEDSTSAKNSDAIGPKSVKRAKKWLRPFFFKRQADFPQMNLVP